MRTMRYDFVGFPALLVLPACRLQILVNQLSISEWITGERVLDSGEISMASFITACMTMPQKI